MQYILYLLLYIILLPSTSTFSLNDSNNEGKTWKCDCDNSTDQLNQCRCYGDGLIIPDDLGNNFSSLVITHSDIQSIKRDDFQPYKLWLGEVILSNLHGLRTIESGSFRDMPELKTLYIVEARQLKFLPGLLEGVTSTRFFILRIAQTGLIEIPDLSHLHNDIILHLIDLDNNKIEKLAANSFKVNAEQATLNYNQITTIENFAFNGSQIANLNLKGNINLKDLHKNSFAGLKSLRRLDLSETSIKSLPVNGLEELEKLKIANTPTLKIIPSIHDFPHLQEAYLTHHFHCCAFKYPEQHNPERHAQFEQQLQEQCKDGVPKNEDTDPKIQPTVRKKRSALENIGFWHDSLRSHRESDYSDSVEDDLTWFTANFSDLKPLRGSAIETEVYKVSDDLNDDVGNFHSSSVDVSNGNPVLVSCGNLYKRSSPVHCYPEPNALNPCEDIMGSSYLRISVWFVVILAVMGNLAVIVVVLFSGGEITVSRFLMSNLAFADFCMGLYLLLIASMDFHSVGSYFNFAFDWQYGIGCQMAGFLTMFASQLSIFTLTVLTVERWFAIAYAIYLTRRIRLGVAAKIMVAGWLYSILMAAIPLMGVSNYSSTSICLPMEVNRPIDKAYLISLMIINGLAFTLIVFCYAQIYFSLGYETRRCSTKGEMTIAKKMALLVFTDFVCWAPIAFFALTALAGYPLIGVTRSKILLVFFYPLNSCANPYLYAIMTAQYRKDFFLLLYRCGICTNKAKKYALNSSIPVTNHTHPLPLLTRNSQHSIKANTNEDVFV
nr:follicle-stimulating hormone receptor-like [Onthophagus taurus]